MIPKANRRAYNYVLLYQGLTKEESLASYVGDSEFNEGPIIIRIF